MATFKKGDRVLCINADFIGKWPVPPPVYLGVYTIDRVLHDGAVTLCEIDLAKVERALIEQGDLPEPGYWPWHFAKLHEPLEAVQQTQKEREVVLVQASTF